MARIACPQSSILYTVMDTLETNEWFVDQYREGGLPRWDSEEEMQVGTLASGSKLVIHVLIGEYLRHAAL